MAWIEDSDQNVLLVRQAGGLKLWTLLGGKVKRGESLVKALKREVYEESGLRVQIGSLLGMLDRRDKDAITLFFVAVSNKQSVNVKQTQKEIKKAGFQTALPKKASPSAKYFWSARFCQKTAENSSLNTSIPRDSGNQAIADQKRADKPFGS
jgi:ADP-ribose pyrophosphatase YjhB (NUDIX family)